jgi:hypothetical protein
MGLERRVRREAVRRVVVELEVVRSEHESRRDGEVAAVEPAAGANALVSPDIVSGL